jgi:MFS family permease
LGGVLLHSMNVLITATLLPSVVAELGGANLMSWPTTAFVASSIIAASGTSLVSGRFENRPAFSGGAVIYAAGAVLCAVSTLMRCRPVSVSVGRLMEFLTILGQDVEVTVKPSPTRTAGHMSVVVQPG